MFAGRINAAKKEIALLLLEKEDFVLDTGARKL